MLSRLFPFSGCRPSSLSPEKAVSCRESRAAARRPRAHGRASSRLRCAAGSAASQGPSGGRGLVAAVRAPVPCRGGLFHVPASAASLIPEIPRPRWTWQLAHEFSLSSDPKCRKLCPKACDLKAAVEDAEPGEAGLWKPRARVQHAACVLRS